MSRADETRVFPGEIWWARPDATVGREQAGRRPVLVVAGAGYLETVATLVLAAPLTTTNRQWPNHIEIPASAGLNRESWAMTEQIRAISRGRLESRIGAVPNATLKDIRLWIADFLDL